MESNILLVDDESSILAGYQRNLRKKFRIETAQGGHQGLKMLQTQPAFAVVVSDMRMPDMDGIQFLSRVREHYPQTVRMMLTGYADVKTAMNAVNEGNIFRFMTKPCPPEVFEKVLSAGIEQYRLITAERDLLERTLKGSVSVMTEILSMVNPDQFGKAMKLRDRVKALAGFLKIPWSWEMELAAMLSPLGSAAIPPEIMVKVHRGQSLSPDEKDMVAAVPRIGEQLLANIPRLASVARIVLYQNKRFDGSGYPRDKLAGHEIPIGAQILKILSDLIELESEDLPRAQALEQMGKRPGWYDPDILKKVAACFLEKGEVKDHSENQPVPVSLCDLRPGHVLESNIETEDGTMLFAAGQKVEPLHLQRLRNYAKLRKIVEPLYIKTLHPESD